MQVFSASDETTTKFLASLTLNDNQLRVIRLERHALPKIYSNEISLNQEGFQMLNDGEKVCLLSYGHILHRVIEVNKKLINENIPLAYDEPCMHEFVVSVKDLKKSHNIKAYDIGKALLDHGYHSPTIYFPLIIDEALMFEPTETQTIDTLNDLANSIRLIVNDVISGKIDITESPFNLPVTRPNELIPAKHLTVKWGDFEDLEIDNRIDE